ncbi:MAG: SdrD B-like domain-containing protein [Kiritimatiellia bacterium]
MIDPLIDFISRTEVTGPDGRYSFTVIINQEYIIRVDPASLPSAACGFTTLSTAAVTFPNLCGVTLVAPDFGIRVCKALGDFVWDDVNQNGVQDPGEPGIPNVTVNLLDINGVQVTNTTTDATGYYLFPALVASNWVVEVVSPAGYEVTTPDAGGDDTRDSDVSLATLRSAIIPLFDQAPPGVLVFTNSTVDAGLFLPNDVAVIKTAVYPVAGTGNVTFDYNLTVTNLGERAATAILVTDVLPAGLAYVSDAAGGTYTPATRTWTAVVPALAAGAATDLRLTVQVTNAVSTAVANTACVEIGLPETSLANNCSTNRLAVLGDFVWRDVNGNGLRDPVELSAGVPGVTVALTDPVGTVLATTVTDASGQYLFNVPAGQYAVTFTAPAGVNFTTANTGANEAVDSDADTGTGATAPVTLAEGGINLDVDAGLLTPTDITKAVSPALPGTGNVRFNYIITVTNLTAIIADPAIVEDPLPVWASYVSDDAGGSAPGGVYTTDVGPLPPNGSRTINVLVEVVNPDAADDLANTATVNQAEFAAQTNAFLGDLVFQDIDHDDVFGPGDLPVSGATVNLYDASGTVQLGSTTTDGAGRYGFIVRRNLHRGLRRTRRRDLRRGRSGRE